MPIEIQAELRRPTPIEFGDLAYDVMACAFEIHNGIGRLFDEKIYKRLMAQRMKDVELEVPVTVRFRDFARLYFLDMLIQGCAVFEWKAVDQLAAVHRAQLLNYLLLSDLPRGKLINVRPERFEHEFVNTTLRPNDRRCFEIDDTTFVPMNDKDRQWRDFLVGAVQDWGAGLDAHLYESAIIHCLGGEDSTIGSIEIVVDDCKIDQQAARLSAPNVAIKLTTLPEHEDNFETHARRFLAHTNLSAIQWVNVTRKRVLFRTLVKCKENQGQTEK